MHYREKTLESQQTNWKLKLKDIESWAELLELHPKLLKTTAQLSPKPETLPLLL